NCNHVFQNYNYKGIPHWGSLQSIPRPSFFHFVFVLYESFESGNKKARYALHIGLFNMNYQNYGM
ncbi:hypothetical protein ABTA59_19420, partial [Acinetobacter baumannii]